MLTVIGFTDPKTPMELRHLRYFAAVAERKNFTRAAMDLRIAQSAVSEQIKILEEELGVCLLKRSRRSVELTVAGEEFLRETREILARADQAMETARRADRGEVGYLSLGCFSSAVAEFLPDLIRAYREQRPRVTVRIAELSPAEQFEALRAREVDVGFTRRIGSDQGAGLVQECVYRDRMFLVLAQNHPLAGQREVRLEKLRNESFVLFERQGAPDLVDQMIQVCGRAGFVPRVVAEAPLMQTVLMNVAAGVGVSFMPGCLRVYRQKGVVFVPFRPAPPAIDLMMVHAKGGLSPTVAAWVALVKSRRGAIRTQMAGAGIYPPR